MLWNRVSLWKKENKHKEEPEMHGMYYNPVEELLKEIKALKSEIKELKQA